MCGFCYKDRDTNQTYIMNVEKWARNGCYHTEVKILARPTANTEPNTYVFILEDAFNLNGRPLHVYVDVHYYGSRITPGKNTKAIGGLWIRGIPGSMKPSQHRGKLLRGLQRILPYHAPGRVDGVWGDESGTARLPSGLSYRYTST